MSITAIYPSSGSYRPIATTLKVRSAIKALLMEEIFSSPLMKRVIAALPAGVELYLVGGAVRDALLGQAML